MTDRFQFRWGIKDWDVGFTVVPNPVLEHYSQVPWKDKDNKEGTGISNQEMLFIIHIASFHYESEQGEARPALGTIQKRMAYKSVDSVRGLRQSLEHKNLLTVKREPGKCNVYDLAKFSKAIMQLDPPTTDPPIPMGGYSNGGVPPYPNGGEEKKKEETTEEKEEREISNSKPPSSSFSTENYYDDEPSIKEQPLEKKEKEISNSNFPSSDFLTETLEWEEPTESEAIRITTEKLSRTFGDVRHLKSNVSRALNLWRATNLSDLDFVEVMEKAAAITKQEISKGNVQRDKRMAYFFAVLEDKLGLREK